jgi:hypothetical protein
MSANRIYPIVAFADKTYFVNKPVRRLARLVFLPERFSARFRHFG